MYLPTFFYFVADGGKKIDTFKPIKREKREDVFEARSFLFNPQNYPLT